MKAHLSAEMKTLDLFQLSADELSALHKIDQLRDTEHKQIGSILNACCQSIMNFICMAIHNPTVLSWCRQNNQESWRDALNDVGEWRVFSCKFKTPTKMPIFDLLAGLLLLCEYFNEENPEKKTFILFVGLEIFNSFHAACKITEIVVKRLDIQEKEIPSMTNRLAKLALLHGCPGYLLYSWFMQNVGEYYLEQKRHQPASAALHLGYQFLLTSAKLEKNCEVEIHNATYGDLPHFLSTLNLNPDQCPRQKIFPSLISRYDHRFSTHIADIKITAQKTASKQAQEWLSSTLSTPDCSFSRPTPII
jgi:hypothetical protein